MIGGDKEAVDRLDPIFAALAPGTGDIPRTPDRERRDPRVERGYMHCGPSGAGRFVKMIHNGIEYGLMQAYAEGFDILARRRFEELPAGPALRARPARHRRGLAPRQRHRLLAPRPHAVALAEAPTSAKDFTGFCPGLRRRPLDGMPAIEEAVPADVLTFALYARFRPRPDTPSAKRCSRRCATVRRPCRGSGEGFPRRHSLKLAEAQLDAFSRRSSQILDLSPGTPRQVIASPPRCQGKDGRPLRRW